MNPPIRIATAFAMCALSAPIAGMDIDTNWANMGIPQPIISGITLAADNGFFAHGFDSIGNVPVNKLAWQTRHGWKTFPSKATWNHIAATALDRNGELFAAGFCDALVPAGAGCLGVWKGKDWQFVSLSAGGRVNKMIRDKEGSLYVGGAFSSIGGVPAQSIARWDGAAWSALGSGTDSSVFQMAFDKAGTTLYVASLSKYGSGQTLKASRWNGAWNAITTYSLMDFTAATFGPGGDIFVSGSPFQAAPPPVIARYSQGKWSSIPHNFDLQEYPSSLLLDSLGVLWAGGSFKLGSGSSFTRCPGASWDGTAWKKCVLPEGTRFLSSDSSGAIISMGASGVSIPAGASIRTAEGWRPLTMPRLYIGGTESVALDSGGNAYVAADSLVWHLAGGIPRQLGSGLPGPVTHLEVSPNGDVYAAGKIGFDYQYFLQKWDGITWIALAKPAGEVKSMSIDRKGKVHIVNSIWVSRWDDTVWTHLGTCYHNGIRSGFAFDKDGILHKTDKGAVYAQNDTGWVIPEFWKTWSGKPSIPIDIFFGPKGDAFVVVDGQTDIAPNSEGFTILHWNGSALEKIGGFSVNESPGKHLSHAFDSMGNLYITGMFDAINIPSQPYRRIHSIARWDGTTWNPLGMGIGKPYFYHTISKVVIDSNDVVHVVGNFDKAGGMPNQVYAVYDAKNALTRLPLSGLTIPRIARKPRISAFRGVLRLHDVLPQDRIQVHALNGARLFESPGKAELRLPALPVQAMIVRVTRKNSVIFSGIVMP